MAQDYSKSKQTTFKWLYKLIKPNTHWAFLSVLSTIVFAACSIFSAGFIKEMIDNALNWNQQSVKNSIVFLIITVIIGLAAKYLMTYSSGILGANTMGNLRKEIMQHIVKLPVSNIENNHSGDFTSRIMNDASALEQFLTNDFIYFIYVPLTVICTFIYLLFINWKLIIFSFISTPIFMYLNSKLSKPIGKYSSGYFTKMGEANSVMQDSIGGINILKTFNLESRLYDKYKTKLEESLNMALKMEMKSHLLLPFIIIMYELPYILCAVLGGYLAVKHELSAGSLVAFLQLLRLLVAPSTQLPGMITNFRRISGAVTRLLEIIDQEIEYENKNGTKIMIGNDTPIIEFIDVTFGYNVENTVLRNVNFKINKGKTTALVGASGCGKSTIINLICSFYNNYFGDIKMSGINIRNCSLHTVRDQLSLVSQDLYLFPGTIEENIRYGCCSASKEEVIAAARLANADEFIMELPEGYDTMAGERGVKLSGGQRQRISLARAILKNAPILLLDEPTSALDAKSEMLVQEALERFSKTKTVLVIAHRLSTIKNADSILVIKDGAIIESGCHEELMNKSGTYKQLYTKQLINSETKIDKFAFEGGYTNA